jgi:enamine deaminase RidA (YjgF/YER057c/UK114 family)
MKERAAMKEHKAVTRRAATLGIAAATGAAWSASAAAQTPRGGTSRAAGAAVEHINPKGIAPPRGYTHVVSASGGRTIYISGQVSTDVTGAIVGRGDLKVQVRQVFTNLKLALQSVDLGPADVVKANTYVVNMKPDDVPVIREARNAFFEGVEPPASTLVGVVALANPDFLIEIEFIAWGPQVAAAMFVR